MDHAKIGVQQGGDEGAVRDGQAVRCQEGQVRLLREGEQVREEVEVECQESEQRVRQGESSGEKVRPQEAVMVKLIDGQWHRLCTGPAHDEPTWLPQNDKYFYRHAKGPRRGRFIARCRLCKAWERVKNPGSEHGWIELVKARPFFDEAANRIGVMELAKRTGISPERISHIIRGHGKYVQKQTLRKVMLELVSIRRKRERSINGLAAWRVVKRRNGYQAVCAGCGTSQANYTEDCPQCQDRKAHRELRQTEV